MYYEYCVRVCMYIYDRFNKRPLRKGGILLKCTVGNFSGIFEFDMNNILVGFYAYSTSGRGLHQKIRKINN